MKNTVKSKPRMTKENWIHAAMDLLVTQGIGSVSIDQVANNLGITRGSFYHHFSNRQELLEEVLEYWAERWTYDVADMISSLDLEPSAALLALMKTIRKNHASDYDAPIRAWALHDPVAAVTVKQVDEFRLAFIQTQFEAMGFKGIDCDNRARLFLYYEMSRPTMLAKPTVETDEQLILERHRFLTTAD